MDEVLVIASLALVGVLAGNCVGGAIHDHRISRLTAGQCRAMHQMRDGAFSSSCG